MSQQPVEGYALSPTGEEIPVKMWECDTVTQAKEKILDAIYKVFHMLCMHSMPKNTYSIDVWASSV